MKAEHLPPVDEQRQMVQAQIDDQKRQIMALKMELAMLDAKYQGKTDQDKIAFQVGQQMHQTSLGERRAGLRKRAEEEVRVLETLNEMLADLPRGEESE